MNFKIKNVTLAKMLIYCFSDQSIYMSDLFRHSFIHLRTTFIIFILKAKRWWFSICKRDVLASWFWSQWWSSSSLFSIKLLLFQTIHIILGIISFSVFFISMSLLLPHVIVSSEWVLLLHYVDVRSVGLINWLPGYSTTLNFISQGSVLVSALRHNCASFKSL